MRQVYEYAIASQRKISGNAEANVGADSAFTWAAPEFVSRGRRRNIGLAFDSTLLRKGSSAQTFSQRVTSEKLPRIGARAGKVSSAHPPRP